MAQALLAALRCAYVALYVCLFDRVDGAFVDIVTLPVAIFALFNIPVLFYCHFPDKELVQTLRKVKRSSKVSNAYRAVIDYGERAALRCASQVVCNSNFTKDVFCKSFPSIGIMPKVVYPCISRTDLDANQIAKVDELRKSEDSFRDKRILLSINRFERKKNIALAIDAFALLHHSNIDTTQLTLVVAGGYDERVKENIEYYEELRQLARKHGVQNHVKFKRNIDAAERDRLLKHALAVLYTPRNEHFGIVPLEAMAAGVVVIAVNNGGPTESVRNSVTGFLCEDNTESFVDAIAKLIKHPQLVGRMSQAASNCVGSTFSPTTLGKSLHSMSMNIACHSA